MNTPAGTRHLYYNMDGTPADRDTSIDWYGKDNDKRTIERTKVGDAMVSTVFLVINHQFGDGPPLIFETMVFGGDDSEPCWRYSTEWEARVGHERIVSALRKGRVP